MQWIPVFIRHCIRIVTIKLCLQNSISKFFILRLTNDNSSIISKQMLILLAKPLNYFTDKKAFLVLMSINRYLFSTKRSWTLSKISFHMKQLFVMAKILPGWTNKSEHLPLKIALYERLKRRMLNSNLLDKCYRKIPKKSSNPSTSPKWNAIGLY